MTPFEEVVRRGDAAAVRALLTERPDLRSDIDRPIFDTAPAIVFSRHDRALVDALLDFGADINTRSQFWGRTIGVLDDNAADMRASLMSRGAVPEISDFVAAVKAEDAATVRLLLASRPALREHIDGEGFTPVASAALRGLVGMVRLLISCGADLEIRNDYGGTALGSCQWGSLNFCNRDGDYGACAAVLLQSGARVSSADFGSEDVRAVLRRHAAGSTE